MRRARKRRVRAGAVDLADAGRAAGADSAGAAAGAVDQSRAGSAHPTRATLALLWSRTLQNPDLRTCRQLEISGRDPENCCGVSVYLERLPDNSRHGAELSGPQ